MSLPAVPNLEQQKKQAKELLDAARSRDPKSLERFRTHHPRLGALPKTQWPPARFALSDAQLVIARENGFLSWPALKEYIEATVVARRTRPLTRELRYYEDRARGLLEVIGDGGTSTIEQVRSWHPRFAKASDEEIRHAAETGAFTLDDARLVYAREHGTPTWTRFRERLRRLGNGGETEPFLDVHDAAQRGNWDRVRSILAAHPDLARARGTNGNTLLNLATSIVAQGAQVPGRLAPVRLLLAQGADPNQPNDRGWTPLHAAGYGNDAELVTLLLRSGARHDLEAHGAGGTPLAVALFWGHVEAADALATKGVVPANLRVAAGLGRQDLIEPLLTPDGRLAPAAGTARGFYRPHSGFPSWKPSNDPQEILDEALVWAAKAGRVEAMAILVGCGALVDADPYRGTPLVWAAANGRLGAITWLLDNGADVNRSATFGGPSHGEGVTALHLAAQNGQLPAVVLLLERGADPAIEDDLYHATAKGWAEHAKQADVAAYLEREGGSDPAP